MDGTKEIARTRYDEDFLVWAREQARAIRARDWNAVDWENVAEEMDSLGISERNELENRIATILEHLLKLDHGRVREPERKWRLTVEAQRDDIEDLMSKMPSLRRLVPDTVEAAWPRARRKALRAFALFEPEVRYDRILPEDNPYALDDVLPITEG